MYLTVYRWKPFSTKEDVGRIMAQYAELGEPPGTVAHYVRRDGQGGVVVTSEMPEYERSLAWGPHLQWEIIPVDEVATIVPAVEKFLS